MSADGPDIDRLLAHVRERCAFLASDRAHYAVADELWAWARREAVNLTPQDRARLERAIYRGTGT